MTEPLMPPPGMILLHAAARTLPELVRLYPGTSVPLLTREALRLADEPQMALSYPRQARVLRERREAARAARSATQLPIISEV